MNALWIVMEEFLVQKCLWNWVLKIIIVKKDLQMWASDYRGTVIGAIPLKFSSILNKCTLDLSSLNFIIQGSCWNVTWLHLSEGFVCWYLLKSVSTSVWSLKDWVCLVFYAEPVEGNLIFHLMDLKVLIPVHHPFPASRAPLVPSYCLCQWSGQLGKGLESGVGNELQLKAIPCFFSTWRCLWEETSRGLEQLVSPVLAWVLRGQLSPSSGCGLEQPLACGKVPGWPGGGWPR